MSKQSTKMSVLVEIKKMEYPGKIYPAREGTISPGLTMYVAEGTDSEQRAAIKARIVEYIKTAEEYSYKQKSTDAEIDKEADELARELVLTRIDKDSLSFAQKIVQEYKLNFTK